MKCLLAGLSFSIFFFSSCNDDHENDVKISDPYQKGKTSMAQIEQKNPSRFLTVTGGNKRNLLGQTVVKGSIFNNAKMVTFKDIEIQLSFYSKTRTLLEEDHDIVYEEIDPGERSSFKSKYFAPKGTDSVGLKIISAKY